MKAQLVFASLILGFSSLGFATVHHRLEISIAPAVKHLTVVDTISALPSTKTQFLLHKDLKVKVLSQNDEVRLLRTGDQNEYELITLDQQVTLQYSGVIYDPVTNNDSKGLIAPEGAVLFGSTYWVPDFAEKATYEILTAILPHGWILASPLSQTEIPQQEIYLMAGPFVEQTLRDVTQKITLRIFLRKHDPGLAQTYLNLLPGYLDHYQKTLGAYPYKSFAVIENFWETGFGMPGFTLLGPGVIRLPYILNSSLPHELLHNWWGNSVFVDYQRGNWCEGLTTYLADHWQQEVLQADRDYRRQSLMTFQDYTKSSADFPLRDFKQRFNFSSQAVGYGKGMMFFHMLKKQLGDQVFAQALRDLYQNYRGHSISYEEIQSSFETTSGVPLKSYFNQWLDRTGAPAIKLESAKLTANQSHEFQVDFELSQSSPQSYELLVPVRFNMENGSQVFKYVNLNTPKESFSAHFLTKPVSLEVDPDFDIFRDLNIQERPVSLSNLFGAKNIWLVGGTSAQQTAYQQAWQSAVATPITVTDDKLLLDLPAEGAVVLLGDSPAYEKLMTEDLKGQDFVVSSEAITLLGTSYSKRENKMAVVARSLSRPGLIITWIRGENLETLAPRLLHYGKYGVLVFAEKTTPLKTTWPTLQSPLKVVF
ncbi:M1 family metallopeptidase [Bdellovibrio sp. HCB337]|uniref:M1 family metallopeptidase n=1 Tax=Bdellovibrio sp. HCB337 TaxID=3394358 RepID=UPI0039A671DE